MRLYSSSLLAACMLVACGGKNGMDSSGGVAATPSRGTLLQSPPGLLSTVTASSLLTELNLAANQQLLALSGTPVCDVLMYDVKYETVGGANEPTTASAALMVPTGAGSTCTGKRPIVLYAHGTTTDRKFTMADLQNAETLALAAVFASKGYIVVAPNYAGYDSSTLDYHPYLIADQQSKDMIDALTAARTALPLASVTLTQDNGQLFLTGYSQGGYVAMATQRAMQAAGMPVTAAAPMSGPYALAAFVDAVFFGEVNGDAPVSSTLLLTAYQRAYGNILQRSRRRFRGAIRGAESSRCCRPRRRGVSYMRRENFRSLSCSARRRPPPNSPPTRRPRPRRISLKCSHWVSARAIC